MKVGLQYFKNTNFIFNKVYPESNVGIFICLIRSSHFQLHLIIIDHECEVLSVFFLIWNAKKSLLKVIGYTQAILPHVTSHECNFQKITKKDGYMRILKVLIFSWIAQDAFFDIIASHINSKIKKMKYKMLCGSWGDHDCSPNF